MPRGHGSIMRRIIKRLRRDRNRYATTKELAAYVGAPISAVRRALVNLVKRGDVFTPPRLPRRWALVKGRRFARSRLNEGPQLEMKLVGGAVHAPHGGLSWP
jgi:hypothetical protein